MHFNRSLNKIIIITWISTKSFPSQETRRTAWSLWLDHGVTGYKFTKLHTFFNIFLSYFAGFMNLTTCQVHFCTLWQWFSAHRLCYLDKACGSFWWATQWKWPWRAGAWDLDLFPASKISVFTPSIFLHPWETHLHPRKMKSAFSKLKVEKTV